MQTSIVVDFEAEIKRRWIAMISIDCVEFPASASVDAGIKINLKLNSIQHILDQSKTPLDPAHFRSFSSSAHIHP